MTTGEKAHAHDRAAPAVAPKHDLGDQDRDADGKDAQHVDQQKGATTVLAGQVGKAPEVTQAHRRADRGQQEGAFVGPDVIAAHGASVDMSASRRGNG